VLKNSNQPFSDSLTITKSIYGNLNSGEPVDLYTLCNAEKISISIINYGGIITSIKTPDSRGELLDIVLGYDSIKDYEEDTYYLGALIGRYAGRIKQGKIFIDDKKIQLDNNAEDSQLHGGINGLNKQLWQARIQKTDSEVSISLTHRSPDGHNGFPGNVSFDVKYTLNNQNQLSVEYIAKTDKATIVNLTQHSYFNLAGHNAGSILDHQVKLNAKHFLPMTDQAYPTGEIIPVGDTPHDFTTLTSLTSNINKQDEQIKIARGYDNYWLLDSGGVSNKNCAAQIIDPKSGRRLTLHTDQPSVILYTGNYLDGSHLGKENTRYQYQQGLCIEPQRAFDYSLSSKNYQPFNTVLLQPNIPFYSKSVYTFDTI